MSDIFDSRSGGMSPPVTGEPPEPAGRQSTWPTAVGVISIVLGGLGTLAYACGGVMSTAVLMFSGTAGSSGGLDPVPQAQMDVAREYVVWNTLSAVGSMSLAIFLLVCGIGVVRRRAWSAKSIRVWAVSRMIYAIGAAALGYVVSVAQFEAMQKAAAETGSGPAMPSWFTAILQGAGAVGAGIGLLIAWAFPVFVLIWFARSSVQAEVADWSGRQRLAI